MYVYGQKHAFKGVIFLNSLTALTRQDVHAFKSRRQCTYIQVALSLHFSQWMKMSRVLEGPRAMNFMHL